MVQAVDVALCDSQPRKKRREASMVHEAMPDSLKALQLALEAVEGLEPSSVRPPGMARGVIFGPNVGLTSL